MFWAAGGVRCFWAVAGHRCVSKAAGVRCFFGAAGDRCILAAAVVFSVFRRQVSRPSHGTCFLWFGPLFLLISLPWLILLEACQPAIRVCVPQPYTHPLSSTPWPSPPLPIFYALGPNQWALPSSMWSSRIAKAAPRGNPI